MVEEHMHADLIMLAPAGCDSRPRWFWGRATLICAMFLLCAMLIMAVDYNARADAAPALVKLEATLKYAETVQATAFSADESLIAAATGKGGATIVFNDRRSKAQLGQITTEAGGPPGLVFSPDSALLLVAGSKALELWEVPIAPLAPGKDLPRKHLRWSVPVAEDAPLGSAGFGSAPGSVVWSSGGAIYRRGTSAGSPFSGKPAGKPAGDPTGESSQTPRLGLPDAGGKLATHLPGEKTVSLLETKSLGTAAKLEGHRFPVVAAHFDHQRALVSVDSGFNLIRWNTDGSPGNVAYLNPPEGTAKPTGALPIASNYHLVLTGDAEGGGAMIVDAATGKVLAVLKSLQPGTAAVSPTGRYIAAAKGKELRLLGFAHPLPPKSYVKQLKARGALTVARNYATYLDGDGLPANLKSQLTALLERTPAKLGLEDFLSSMTAAEAEGNLENMVYWASKALDVEENHPHAMAVMAKVAAIREERVFTQARTALELGQHRQAITMLTSQVPANSMRYSEALQVIRQAERDRALQTSLEQARDKLNLGDYPAARALVNDVLRRYEDQPAALALQEEISDRAGSFYFEPLTFVFLAILGVALISGGMYRMRHLLAPILRRFSLVQAEPAWGPAGARGAGVAEKGDPAARPAPPRSTRDAPRQDAYGKERRRLAQELLEGTEEMIRMARLADIKQQHSSFLLEQEAELSAIRRRLDDANVDLPAVSKRLDTMRGRVRRLKFVKVVSFTQPGSEVTYYDILRLSPQASDAEIKTAYHKLLKEYHPDLHSQSTFGWVKEEAEQMSRKLSEAYEVLSDSAKREQYNRTLPKKKGA